jgi:PTS system cellobiose-specific IIA component
MDLEVTIMGIIGADEGEGKTPVTLVMVHAQDHLMTTIQAIENARETVHLYQRLSKLEQTVVNSIELA